MISLEIRSEIQRERQREFRQTFDLIAEKGSHGIGCKGQNLFECVGNNNQFLWVSHWENKKALDDYRQKGQFRSILGAIDVLGSLIDIKVFSELEE